MKRSLGIVVHKSKPMGSVARDFMEHCMRTEAA
jgi:hypothetical protein